MKRTPVFIILHNLKQKVKRYFVKSNDNYKEKPDGCELCSYRNCMNWHNWYERMVITMFGKFRIWVKRVYCKNCGGSFVVLPDFIIKFCRYAKDVIREALMKLRHCTYLETSISLPEDISVSIGTLFIWNKKYKPS